MGQRGGAKFIYANCRSFIDIYRKSGYSINHGGNGFPRGETEREEAASETERRLCVPYNDAPLRRYAAARGGNVNRGSVSLRFRAMPFIDD